jgi:hypothetical protein
MGRFTTPGVESLTPGAVGAPGDGLEGIYSGIVNSVPSGGECLVVVPGLDPLHHMEAICPPNVTVVVGDPVLVNVDDNKQLWIVASPRASATPTTTSLDPHQAPWNVPTNGTSDAAASLNTAIAAAASLGIPVQLRAITYKISSGPLIQTSGSYIKMQPGTVLDASALASGSTSYAIKATGTTGSPLYLTADAAVGAYTVTMGSTDAATLSVDQWVQIGSNETFPYLTSFTVARGELRQIRSISGGVVTLTVALDDTYHVGSSHADAAGGAFVRPVTFVNNIGFDFNGGKLIGSGTSGDYECGIFYQYVNGLELTRANVQKMDDILITLSSVIDFNVDEPETRSLYYSGGTGTSNEYGILISDSCQNGTVQAPKASRVRHNVSVSSTGSGQGVWGEPSDVTIIDGYTWDCMGGSAHGGQGDAYEHHGFGRRIKFINCNADGVDALASITGGACEFSGEGRNCYFAGIYINGDPRALTGLKVDARITQASKDGGSVYGSYLPVLIEATLAQATAPFIVGQMDINVEVEWDATAGSAIRFEQSGAGGSHIQAYSVKLTGNLRNVGASTGDNYAILTDYWDGLDISGVDLYDCYRLIQGYGNDVKVHNNNQWASAQGGGDYVIRAEGANWRIWENAGRATRGIFLTSTSSGCWASRNPMDCTTVFTNSGTSNTVSSNGLV